MLRRATRHSPYVDLQIQSSACGTALAVITPLGPLPWGATDLPQQISAASQRPSNPILFSVVRESRFSISFKCRRLRNQPLIPIIHMHRLAVARGLYQPSEARPAPLFVPTGRHENSPVLSALGIDFIMFKSPKGTAESRVVRRRFSRPFGTSQLHFERSSTEVLGYYHCVPSGRTHATDRLSAAAWRR